jgi:hypothetical protein
MADRDDREIEERFERLSFDAKLRVLERLVRHLRRGTVDSCGFERSVSEMATDPAVLRELGGAASSQS